MTTKTVRLTYDVEVAVDESKFTPEFMSEFRDSFYDFVTIEEHMKHLADLYTCFGFDEDSFIEGYGKAREMGIKFNTVDSDSEVVEPEELARTAPGGEKRLKRL